MPRFPHGDMGNIALTGFLTTNHLARLAGVSKELHETVTRPVRELFIDREDTFSKIWTGVQHVVLQRTDEFIPQDEHLVLIAQRFPELTRLDLPNAWLISNDGMWKLDRLINLEHLDIRGCHKITDNGVKALTSNHHVGVITSQKRV